MMRRADGGQRNTVIPVFLYSDFLWHGTSNRATAGRAEQYENHIFSTCNSACIPARAKSGYTQVKHVEKSSGMFPYMTIHDDT